MRRIRTPLGRVLRPSWMARSLRSLPAVSRLGVVVLGAGFATDVGYHVATGSASVAVPCCGAGFWGHVVTLVGMVLVIGGILQLAFRPRPRHAPGGRRP